LKVTKLYKTFLKFKQDNVNNWHDWKWQQRNIIRDEDTLRKLCNDEWDLSVSAQINANLQVRKMQITPYYLQLILNSNEGNIINHSLWKQVVPFWREEIVGSYDGETENWELNQEMKTPICQHKYDNRVILRMSNTCNSYCQFCFEALRTLDKKSGKNTATKDLFYDSFEYIKSNPQIQEVIFSGGDPLMLTDDKLEQYISVLREWSKDLLIRIHTRALTFNPYRITDKFIEILEKYKINSFGVHVCHPAELTEEFIQAVKRIQKVVPIIFANMPFLRGVNDDESILHELFINLYRIGVKPYYLYHFMPFSPGASEYKASVKDGIRIMHKLKRRVSNIAMPEYVLPHVKGKFTVPLIENSDDTPKFELIDGKMYYKFSNWNGEKCSWNDE
jgi:lysine 2,3-aminomutase